MEKSNTNVRKSNIELLRIIAMLLIVTHHFAVHSYFPSDTSAVTLNTTWLQMMQVGGNVGVNLFVLISGYFLIDSTELKINKLLKLWLQIFTYSIVLYFVFVAIAFEKFSISGLIEHIMPVSHSQWWFASTYFILFLLSPYLGMMLKSLKKVNYQKLLFTMFIMWCIFPTFLGIQLYGNFLWWFVFMFAVGGYIKIYIPFSDWSNTKLCSVTGTVIALCYLTVICFHVVGTKISWLGSHSTYLFGLQMLPSLLMSTLLFLSFSRIDIKYSKIINTISSSTFGIYLLHDYTPSRDFIWVNIFNNSSYIDSPYLIPYSLLAILLVFTTCMIIELLRINILEKHYMKLINKISFQKPKKE